MINHQVKDIKKFIEVLKTRVIIYYIIGRRAQNMIYHEMDPFFLEWILLTLVSILRTRLSINKYWSTHPHQKMPASCGGRQHFVLSLVRC